MRFDRLTVRDFGQFADRTFAFGPGLNVVLGENEAGKSTLRDALTFVLFQDAKGRKADLIARGRWGARERFALTLEFTDDDKPYTLVRDFQSRTNRLETPDGDRPLQDHDAIASRLRELLGITSRSVFESTVRISQRDLTEIQSEQAIADSLQRTLTGGSEDVTAYKVIGEIDSKLGELRRNGAVNRGILVALPARIAELNLEAKRKRDSLSGAASASQGMIELREALDNDQSEFSRLSSLLKASERVISLQRDLEAAESEEAELESRFHRASDIQKDVTATETEFAAVERILEVSAERFESMEADSRTIRRDLSALDKAYAAALSAEAALRYDEGSAATAAAASDAQQAAHDEAVATRLVELATLSENTNAQLQTARDQVERIDAEIVDLERAGAEAARLAADSVAKARLAADSAADNLASARMATLAARKRHAERRDERISDSVNGATGKGDGTQRRRNLANEPFALAGAGLALVGATILIAVPGAAAIGAIVLLVGGALAVWALTRPVAVEVARTQSTTTGNDQQAQAEVSAAVEHELNAEREVAAADRAFSDSRRLASEQTAEAGASVSILKERASEARFDIARATAELAQLDTERRMLLGQQAADERLAMQRRASEERLARERRGVIENALAEAARDCGEAHTAAEEARERLRAALTETGCETLDDLRERRQSAFELKHRLDSLKAELRGLLGRDTLAGIDAARRIASRRVRDLREASQEPELALAARDVASYQSVKQQAEALSRRIAEHNSRLPELQAIIIANEGGYSELHAIEEEVADLKRLLEEATERHDTLKLVRDVIDEARTLTLVTAQQKLEERLGSIAGQLTGGRYSRVLVDPANLALSVTVPGLEKPVPVILKGALSQGTVEQIYLAARLALGELLSDGRHPPIILDDPFVAFDPTRARAALDLCARFANDSQVILFTKDPEYAQHADHVVTLSSPSEQLRAN